MLRFYIDEIIENQMFAPQFNGTWSRHAYPTKGGFAVMSEEQGSSFSFVSPGGKLRLSILRHSHSGMIEVETSDKVVVVDLYSDSQNINFYVELPDVPAGETVRVVNTGQRNAAALGRQVWLFGLEVEKFSLDKKRSDTLSENVRVIRGIWGTFLTLMTDTDIPDVLLREGAWASCDIEIFKANIKPGDFVIDVGANFGHHSVVFSKLVGNEGAVASIEAQRAMYMLLNANAIVNNGYNIYPFNVAASNKEGELVLYPVNYSSNTNFGSLGINLHPEKYSAENAAETVIAVTLDELVGKQFPNKRVNFVKIDVQSFELFVLQGMSRLLKTHMPIVFCEISPKWMLRNQYDYREIYYLLKKLGYSFRHTAEWVDLNSDGIPQLANDDVREWDVLALPPE